MNPLHASVLKALLTKRGWHQYKDIINAEIITNQAVRSVLGHLGSIHEATEGDVTTGGLEIIIVGRVIQEERREELIEIVKEIDEAETLEDAALMQAVQQYAGRELAAQASRYVATHLDSDALDLGIPLGMLERAVDISEQVHSKVLDLDDTGVPGTDDDRPGITPLGISDKLDTCLGGGIAAGELAVVLAPPARGKTSVLCAIGARAAQRGRRVLHITLEISAVRVGRRYDSVLTGLRRQDMIAAPGAVLAERKRLKDNGGSVSIKDWSYTSVTPADIKGLVNGLRREGMAIDFVIVDYLELMTANRFDGSTRREQRHVFGQMGKDLRAAAVSLNVPIVTAWQVNRAGSDLDTITEQHVSECWDIIKHADQIIGLNQTSAERENRSMRLGVLKQRTNTERPQIYIHADLDRCQLRDIHGAVRDERDETLDPAGDADGGIAVYLAERDADEHADREGGGGDSIPRPPDGKIEPFDRIAGERLRDAARSAMDSEGAAPSEVALHLDGRCPGYSGEDVDTRGATEVLPQ